MKKYIIGVILSITVWAMVAPLTAHAADLLQVRPLIYKEKLNKGEAKHGAVDIANGSDKPATYNLSVRLFRQVSNDGTLEFYDRPDITAGIHLDATEVDLQSKEAARITFSIDSSKLPSGDIFAVILVTTKHTPSPQTIVPAAQVGTLLVLQNGEPGPRIDQIELLTVPRVQIGDKLSGTVTVKNPASADTSTGFFPRMTVKIVPWGASTQFDGPLVYAGRSRTFDFSVPSSQFGLYKVIVTANNATASRYVFLITGKWRLILPLIAIVLVIIAGLGFLVRLFVKKRRTNTASK